MGAGLFFDFRLPFSEVSLFGFRFSFFRFSFLDIRTEADYQVLNVKNLV